MHVSPNRTKPNVGSPFLSHDKDTNFKIKNMTKSKKKFEGKIEPLNNEQKVYMVWVEDSIYPPKQKHDNYESAFEESLRLSKKENKTAYVLIAVTKVELIPNITQFKNLAL